MNWLSITLPVVGILLLVMYVRREIPQKPEPPTLIIDEPESEGPVYGQNSVPTEVPTEVPVERSNIIQHSMGHWSHDMSIGGEEVMNLPTNDPRLGAFATLNPVHRQSDDRKWTY